MPPASARPTPAIELIGIGLDRDGRHLLRDIHWTIPTGDCVALLGPNGAGKSTLLSIIGGFTWPQQGSVRVLGQTYGQVELARVRRRIGWVGHSRLPTFHGDMTALETVLAGFWGTVVIPPRERPGPARRDAARRELAAVGLERRAATPMDNLSSGEQMRVLLARALVARPELLILDEPATSLDLGARAAFTGALERLHAGRAGLTFLLVTHHVEDLPGSTSQVLLLKDGRPLAAGPPADVLTGPLLSRAFGCEVELRREDGRFWTRVRPPRGWRL